MLPPSPDPRANSPAGGPAPVATAAVVLAGGASRRMGRPKPFLRVGERELLQRALDAAAAVCARVVLVGSEAGRCRQAALRYGWRPEDPADEKPGTGRRLRRGASRLLIVEDRRPGLGPLAGLETARIAGPADVAHWWALAADLPFASPELGRGLLAELRAWEAEADRPGAGGSSPATTASIGRAVVAAADGRLQPLCAAYGAEALEAASRCLDAEIRAVGAFLGRLRVRRMELPPTEGWRLLNVNTEEQLREARARAREASSPGAGGGEREGK